MPTNFGEAISSIGGGAGGILTVIIWIFVIGLLGLVILGFLIWWWFFKKKWNIKVEFKMIRSDGQYVYGEWGKGFFNAKRGVVFIKRPGIRQPKIPMKVFDVKKYLQGDNLLTVVQISPDDYRPVLPSSYTTHEVEYEEFDDETGKPTGETKVVKETLLNIKTETGLNKAWKSAFEEASKQAYSLKSFFTQFQTPIAIGIVIVCCFVGFAILWTKIG